MRGNDRLQCKLRYFEILVRIQHQYNILLNLLLTSNVHRSYQQEIQLKLVRLEPVTWEDIDEANLYSSNTSALQALPVLETSINIPVPMNPDNQILDILNQIRVDQVLMRGELVQMRGDLVRMQLQLRNSHLLGANMVRNNTDCLSMLFNAGDNLPMPPLVYPKTKLQIDTMTNHQITALLNFYGIALGPNRLAHRKQLLKQHIGAV